MSLQASNDQLTKYDKCFSILVAVKTMIENKLPLLCVAMKSLDSKC